MRICAECKNFLGCADWDICCKKQARRLTYEYCEACDGFEPGRDIAPIITANLLGERHAWKPNGKTTFDECIETALELEEQGYEDVQIRDDNREMLYPLLWSRRLHG